MPSQAATAEKQPTGLASPVWKRSLTFVAGVGLWTVILFVAAGRLNWTRGWFYVALYVSCLVVNEMVVRARNPGILNERTKRHAGAKTFDRVILPTLALTFFAFPVVAGLDAVRFGWSRLSASAIVAGAPLFLAGSLFGSWAWAVNPFLEPTVRIQQERGHHVIRAGPYAIVRHPMYAGIILQSLGAPLLLGSLWSYAPIAVTIVLLVVRTSFEDRTLRDELPGYEEYTGSTRHRLLPGVW